MAGCRAPARSCEALALSLEGWTGLRSASVRRNILSHGRGIRTLRLFVPLAGAQRVCRVGRGRLGEGGLVLPLCIWRLSGPQLTEVAFGYFQLGTLGPCFHGE